VSMRVPGSEEDSENHEFSLLSILVVKTCKKTQMINSRQNSSKLHGTDLSALELTRGR
jgi:hypothetical protein